MPILPPLRAATLPGRLQLRDYQRDTLDSLLHPPADVWRDLAVLATGAGKTIIFASLLRQLVRPGTRGLVLAHRDELLTQARDKIAMVDPTLHVELERNSSRATRDFGLFADTQRSVVVGSVQSLHAKRRKEFDADAFSVVVVDEAHHATSDSYLGIFEHFGCLDPARRTPLIGVTATPNRSDGVALGKVFQRIAASYTIKDLVERGYLVAPRAIRVSTQTDLSRVKMTGGDFNVAELEEAVNTNDRNALIVAAYRQYAYDRQGIAFTAGVQHARELADMLSAAGIPSAAVYNAMGEEARQETLGRFACGELQVLTNFGILTEGYDNPRVSAVVLGRPTPSDLLLTQMVGRGLRLHDGKVDCICIDVQDVTTRARCVSVPTLAGLPRDFDARGESIFAAKKKFDSLDVCVASLAKSFDDVEELIARAAEGLRVVEVDLLADAALDPVIAQSSRLMWSPLGPDVYGLTIGSVSFVVQSETLGTWTLFMREGATEWRILTEDIPDSARAFEIADTYIESNFDVRLVDRTAPWRKKKISTKQIQLMVNLGLIRSAHEVPNELRQGQASRLIDDALARRRQRLPVEPLMFMQR